MTIFSDQLKTIKQMKEAEKQAEIAPLVQAESILNNIEQAVLNLGKRVLDEFDDPTFQAALMASTSIDAATKQLIADLRADIETKPAKAILNDAKYIIFFPVA